MATTDNSIDLARRIPEGSYILNKEASDMFPNMKNVASMFSATKNEMLNGDNVMLTDEETYIPPSGVEAIGVEMLEFMNNKPDEGGHSSIDNLINMATLENIKPMYKGGEIKSYMGGGYNMDGYEDGGSVNMDDVLKRKMLMKRFGNVFNQELDKSDRIANFSKAQMLMDKSSGLFKDFVESETGYSASGDRGNLTDKEYYGGMRNLQNEKDMLIDMFRSSLTPRQPEGMQGGGMMNKNLKPMPSNNPGLAKLPENIRNKMGYMQDGGMMGMMYGGMKKKNMYGYQDGGMIQDDAMMQQYLQQQQMMQQPQQGGNGFVPLDQRPPNSGGTMSTIPEGMQQGDMMRMIRDSVAALKEQEDLLTIQKADTTLQRIEQSRMLEEPFINRANTSSNRNYMEYLKQQSMQRGADNVRTGGGEDMMEMIR